LLLASLLRAARPLQFQPQVHIACNLTTPGAGGSGAPQTPASPGARLYAAVRRNQPPQAALAAAGTTALVILATASPVIPGFTAESSALARELARRTLRGESHVSSPAGRTHIVDPRGEGPDYEDTAEFRDALPLEGPTTTAPPSPGLRRETMALIQGQQSPSEPHGLPQDWIDADGPGSLQALCLGIRVIRDAATFGRDTPRFSIAELVAFAVADSATWPHTVWAGEAGTRLNARLGRELDFAEQVGSLSVADIVPCADPPSRQPRCAAEALCAGPHLLRGYVSDEPGVWWCDLCWDMAQLPILRPGQVSVEPEHASDTRPVAHLWCAVDTLHLTPYLPTTLQYLQWARRHAVVFRGCSNEGGYLVGEGPVLAFLARWLLPATQDPPQHGTGSRQTWMEFLEDDTEAASYNASSSLPAIIPSPATLLRPPFPMDETAVRDTMDAVFAAAPLSADLGCPLGIWFKHVRIRCRPWTCDEEVLLSRLMRQVLRNSARYRVNEGVGFLRAPLDPSEVRPPQPPDEPTEGAQRDRRALAGHEHVHMTGSDAQHSTRVPHQPRPPPPTSSEGTAPASPTRTTTATPGRGQAPSARPPEHGGTHSSAGLAFVGSSNRGTLRGPCLKPHPSKRAPPFQFGRPPGRCALSARG